MATATINFAFEKSTKGAHRFKEVDGDNNLVEYKDTAIGTLYIRKSYFGDKAPKSISVEITTHS